MRQCLMKWNLKYVSVKRLAGMHLSFFNVVISQVYVRGPKEEPNVSSFISQVIFFLHPSYAPHDTIHVL